MNFKNFPDFYRFYLDQHRHPVCRYWHYFGSTLVLLGLLYSLATQSYHYLLLLPIIGYGCAWTGHFVFEKNRPATFGHPLYSLLADWLMYGSWLLSPWRRGIHPAGTAQEAAPMTTADQHPPYQNVTYTSDDGLQLYARDYRAQADAPVLLCLHGLTRNSADFEPLCARLASRYRLLVPDQRGRGRSAWDSNAENYQPLRYNSDMLTLLNVLGIERVHIVGTSMGGIMGMVLAAQYPQLIASLVLNDIGPEVHREGLAAIAAMVKAPPRYPDWQAASAGVKRYNAAAFPDYGDSDWMAFARRTCRAAGDEVIPDYDPAIGKAFVNAEDTAAPDLWPVFSQLQALPMLAIHGALSTILTFSICDKMRAAHPGLKVVSLSNRGHAPILDEPEAVTAIEEFLASHCS